MARPATSRAELSTEDDVQDFVRGLTLLGTGGGGRPDVGLDYLLSHVRDGRRIAWVGPETIADEAWACMVFGMGSIAPTRTLSVEERRNLGYPAEWRIPRPMVRAVEELQAYTGRRVEAILPFELGAANSAAPVDTALRLGLAVVDGDAAGRAVPELVQTTAALAGISFAPGVVVDPWGNVLIVKETGSDLLAERIGKMISLATKLPDVGAPCAHAGFLMTGRDLKRIVVPGGLTRALAVGRAIRDALVARADPMGAAAEALGGWVLFRGTVTKKEWESREGYMYGTVTIAGDGEDLHHTLEVWFKNEHHISWRDGTPWVTSPDLIMVADADSGEPYTNAALPEGARVGVLVARADAKLRTPGAVELLGPRHYGYEFPYRPVEMVLSGA
jgi:hypothetical protein